MANMTFGECHHQLSLIVPGDFSLKVEAWRARPGVTWNLYAEKPLVDGHFVTAATPERLIEKVVEALSSRAQSSPMAAPDVRIDDTTPAAAPGDAAEGGA